MSEHASNDSGFAEALQAVHDSAFVLEGEDGAAEAEFAMRSYHSAFLLALRVGPITPTQSAQIALARQFRSHAAMHLVGARSIVFAAAHPALATPAATEAAFWLLRNGALNAYTDIRQIMDLREPQQEALIEPASDEECRQAIAWAEADLVAG